MLNHTMKDYLIGLLISVCFGFLMGMCVFTSALTMVLGILNVLYLIPSFLKVFNDYNSGSYLYATVELVILILNVILCVKCISSGLNSLNSRESTLSPIESWDRWPPNDGAVEGSKTSVCLEPGEKIARYGGTRDNSRYFTVKDANPNHLALKPGTDINIYETFIITREIPEVTQSIVSDWAGSKGGGIQYELPLPVRYYLDNGFIILGE